MKVALVVVAVLVLAIGASLGVNAGFISLPHEQGCGGG